jgi:sirohydrochlorin cobaltochelatase
MTYDQPRHQHSPQALILFAHGSRDPDWARPLHGLRDAVAALCPQLPVTLAFLEFMQPTLTQVIAQLAGERGNGASESGASSQPLQPLQPSQPLRQLRLVPLFLAQGNHTRRDLAALIAQAQQDHPGLQIEVLPALGEVPAVMQALAQWIASIE